LAENRVARTTPMAYYTGVQFVETPVFTQQVGDLLEPDAYRALQLAIFFRPEQGALIPGGGGLRKLRWRTAARGKRGGLRVIYYWEKNRARIYMLMVYPKSRQENLTPAQKKILARLVREELE
jgi:mRNA-degrading endonuclease RelE of RelBE toxin-antitoxin system